MFQPTPSRSVYWLTRGGMVLSQLCIVLRCGMESAWEGRGGEGGGKVKTERFGWFCLGGGGGFWSAMCRCRPDGAAGRGVGKAVWAEPWPQAGRQHTHRHTQTEKRQETENKRKKKSKY